MKGSIAYLLMSWLTFTTACGYRTPPVPYDLPDKTISTIDQASLKAQGNSWVFRWKIPTDQSTVQSSATPQGEKAAVEIFRINILRATSECPFCIPEALGQFLIDLSRNDITADFPSGTIPPTGQRFYIDGKVDFRFDLPSAFFKDNGFIDHSFYTIDYHLGNGILSVPSQKLYPLDLKTLPLPKVRTRKRVSNIRKQQLVRIDSYLVNTLNRYLSEIPDDVTDATPATRLPQNIDFPLMPALDRQTTQSGVSVITMEFERFDQEVDPFSEDCEEEKPQLEYFLLLEWDLQQETMRHTLQKDGKFSEEVIHYGINFYTKPKLKPRTEPADYDNLNHQDETSGLIPHAEAKFEQFENPEHLINSGPLLYGSFSLFNFQGLISARHVDRFGNESGSIPVFDGRY
ncbi:MAG: hypothetical protein HQ517_15940 [SAR324 cluster bacterium]|nr:hypothetical protein [SAR324 cluster bacterium]